MTRNANSTAEYIGDLTSDLAEMARSEGLEVLAYLLEIAALEAAQPHGLSSERITDIPRT